MAEIKQVQVREPWLGLKRRQWLELEDLPWWPAPWRDAGTAFLAIALKMSGHATIVARRIESMLARTGELRVLDLGSGGGGPMESVAAALSSEQVKIQLTDLHPNREALQGVVARTKGRVSFSETPVDATAVSPELPGLRTLINAFHHLPVPAARAVLQSAVEGRRPITIIEVVSRSPLHLLAMLFAPLNFALTLPLQRPFKPANWFFTYLLPVLPAFVLWDGVVSWARIYSPAELNELVESLRGASDWHWEIGCFQLGKAPLWGVYLEGRPPDTT